mgnify:CR=1 FL=1
MSGISNAIAVVAGGAHSCALKVDGTARCWGSNASRQIGAGTTSAIQFSPILVRTNGMTALAAGRAHSCARRADGSAVCWGAGDFGQIGNGVIQSFVALPTTAGNGGFTSAIAGDDFTCAPRPGADVQCWGRNDRGQLGSPVLGNQPSLVTMPVGAVHAAGGQLHTCVMVASGAVLCAGETANGRIGNGVTALGTQPAPQLVQGLSSVAALSAGQAHACAVRGSGQVFCWGLGASHQLGNGSTADRAAATAVAGF